MSTQAKDSEEVIKFMTLFARLKDRCDEDPAILPEDAKNDASLRELCESLGRAAFAIELAELSQPTIVRPVGRAFIGAWRDYQARYSPYILRISPIFKSDVEGVPPTKPPSPYDRWEMADFFADEEAGWIEDAIQAGEDHAESMTDEDAASYVSCVNNGVMYWRDLKAKCGFDPRGVLRRKKLTPRVLVPTKVSKKYGDADKLSMLKNLEQAHHAFVHGAPFAALALIRSTMEVTLVNHYGAEGQGLDAVIADANRRGLLPAGVNADRLRGLKDLADGILHLNPEKAKRLVRLTDIQLENEIVSLLYVLRNLIEGVR